MLNFPLSKSWLLADLPKLVPQRNLLLSSELAKAQLLGGPYLTWQSREVPAFPGPHLLVVFLIIYLQLSLNLTWNTCVFFNPTSCGLKKKKKKNNWQFLTVWILSFHSGSHTAELYSLVKQTNYRGSIMLLLQNRKLGLVMAKAGFT